VVTGLAMRPKYAYVMLVILEPTVSTQFVSERAQIFQRRVAEMVLVSYPIHVHVTLVSMVDHVKLGLVTQS